MSEDCQRCRHRNPTDSRYCCECGMSLLEGWSTPNRIDAYPATRTWWQDAIWIIILAVALIVGYLIGVAAG